MSDQSLKEWVRQKYQSIGIGRDGNFIGKQLFTERLISNYGITTGAELDKESWLKNLTTIRQLVLTEAYLPESTAAAARKVLSTSKPSAALLKSEAAAKVSAVKTLVQSSKPQVKAGISAAGKVTAKSTIQPPSPKVKASASTASNVTAKSAAQPPKVKTSASTASKVTAKSASRPPSPKVKASASNAVTAAETTIQPLDLKLKTSNHDQVVNKKIQELIKDTGAASPSSMERSPNDHNILPKMPSIEQQLRLLDLSDHSQSLDFAGPVESDVRDAILFSAAVLTCYQSELFPQYGLLGSVSPTKYLLPDANTDPRLFLNSNVPFSAFICGLQGSGKSHTVSCILENCLIQTPILGVLQRPLSALVFHFSQYTSRSNFQPCEAAFLAYRHPNFREYMGVSSVHILVAPSNYHNLKASYSHIPDLDIRPFKLKPKHLNINSMLTLMSVDQTESAPLYIGQITRILRDLATKSAGGFDYLKFQEAVKTCKLTPAQKAPLQQRLDLLESFLDLDDSIADYEFRAGSITIIDLSCPFVDTSTACILFNICIGMYLGSDPTVGKLIALDESHKYMTNTPASNAFTETLLSVIRQQRHYGARVIISTQEPTISPRLIDLCSVIIIHRFSSPEWFQAIRRHVSLAETDKTGLEGLFGRIVNLHSGEALLFAPSTILSRREDDKDVLFQLSSGLLKVKIRKRLTWDGGKSVLCL